MSPEKTYDELRVEAEREWARKQAEAGHALRSLQAAVAQMPDVRDAPPADAPWGHPEIACRTCGSEGFLVKRWVTVNGRRYRAELKCLGCKGIGTWDWDEARWLG